MLIPPLVILAVGVLVVVGMILLWRVNAFIALMTAAIVVSLMAPGEVADKVSRVASAFGASAGKIGVVIAMAAVIGQCMMDSGAAERIVRLFLGLLGQKRGATALAGSGYVLGIPVFFDTVFYLLVPLARSMHRRTGVSYLNYIMAITAGGALTHNLVPPTPGPLTAAELLSVDIGTMIGMGMLVSLPGLLAGMAFSAWADRRMAIPMRELEGEAKAQTPAPDRLPSLAWSLAPIVLPVVLISANTAMTMIARDQTGAKNAAELLAQAKAGSGVAQAAQWAALLGDANLALMLSAGLAVWTLVRQRRMSGAQLAASIETSLLSAGLIILITAAGGAFGAMLNAAKIGPAIEAAMGGGPGSRLAGLALLGFAFVTSSLIKFAQGSSTVAVITTAGVLAAMLPVEATIGFNRVYLATAVASGALVGSWMNDSGFWIFCKMGGLTEVEALKTWTPLLAILGCVSMVTTVALAMLWPMV